MAAPPSKHGTAETSALRRLAQRVEQLRASHDEGTTSDLWDDPLKVVGWADDLRPLGPARKVSVSLPEGLADAVRQRVGKGEFSHYVAEAVARQLELDLLAELAAELEEEHGPVPEELLAEARDAWPDRD